MCLVNLVQLTASKFKVREKEREKERERHLVHRPDRERKRKRQFAFVGRKSVFAKILSSYVTDSCQRNYAAMPPQLDRMANALAPGLLINGSLHKPERIKCSDVLSTNVTQIFECMAGSTATIYHGKHSQCSVSLKARRYTCLNSAYAKSS